MPDDSEYLDQLVDEEPLREYLETRLGETDTFDVSYHEGGNSNEILFVTWGDADLVLRRPPPGKTASTAHDVLREYRVLSALQETPVPVPRTVLQCEDSSLLGAEFYLMERVDGEIIGYEEPDRFATPKYRRAVGAELVETLAHIHTVNFEEIGLEDFGRPDGFTQRQVERWSKQMVWIYEEKDHNRQVPALESLRDWLKNHVPESHHSTLVHGDFRLDNMMFGTGTPPELVAVLDWELSTLGDPLTDLGFLLAHWRDPKDEFEPAIPEWTAPHTEHPDYLSRRDLVDRYEELTDMEFSNERFYRALAVFKEAVAGEMFFRRYLDGETSDPLYPRMRDRVPAMANRGLRITTGEDPL
ncbi:phosphotransferase family protein [Natrinema gelatinilyticum]|uniref:phosphotransferase family protein n=1 Tax=Natrinema gelatinilyticum TaxID=2961571 RepID=UPI0020C32466|nr:phosphotransferase family protein [Natrinema gelatinilyticum]